MKFQYFDDSDMLYIKLMDGISAESEEAAPGIVLDFTETGRVMGIEIEDASKFIELSQFEVLALPITNFAFNRQNVAVGKI